MSKYKLSRRNFILGSLSAAFGIGVSFSGPTIFARAPSHIDGTLHSRSDWRKDSEASMENIRIKQL